jgi:hypothetical protein
MEDDSNEDKVRLFPNDLRLQRVMLLLYTGLVYDKRSYLTCTFRQV